MTQRLTQKQLTQIIAEVQGLQIRREGELDQEQVKEILQELNLPPELLDEALIQLRRRQGLEVKQRRSIWLISVVVAGLVVAIASTIYFNQQRTAVLSRVSTQRDRISLISDDGSSLKAISRQTNPEVFYRVTLKDAPIGQKLSLSCMWIDPTGQIVKENTYQTREINTNVWDTHCRYRINSAAPVGDWTVKMFLEGRMISDETFEVK
ncbi:DUF3859 domain-containing protein [Cylindrospermum sp. FACHB-282]|uniref:DUF3859 domain-containing protein n=1 Tax=Cylindrospermum sp. FACHB-282 TaxID=2692794 RepID=UPI001687427E|nr:DUF3859 domain-containing protein [Cylindrospermum sp. FACHB-282]MBD2388031.1 DUF3859 domain-containing protein [Cylindrospermum sp. FACHB-282]